MQSWESRMSPLGIGTEWPDSPCPQSMPLAALSLWHPLNSATYALRAVLSPVGR